MSYSLHSTQKKYTHKLNTLQLLQLHCSRLKIHCETISASMILPPILRKLIYTNSLPNDCLLDAYSNLIVKQSKVSWLEFQINGGKKEGGMYFSRKLTETNLLECSALWNTPLRRFFREELKCRGESVRSQNGKCPQEMLKGRHIFHLVWERLAIPAEEKQDTTGGEDMWATLLAEGRE